MSKHTPGPWRLMPLEDGAEYLRIRGTRLGHRYKVCNVHAPFQHLGTEVLESQANARLIAAAPDLLECLSIAVEVLENVTPSGHRGSDSILRDTITEARAAIAKATGEEA